MRIYTRKSIKPIEVSLIYAVITLLPFFALGFNKLNLNKSNILISSYLVITLFLTLITMFDLVLKKPFLSLIFGCHNMCNRTFKLINHFLPICSRCTGIFIGLYLSFIRILLDYNFLISTLLMLPLILDGLIQLKTSYMSNNIRRLFTGVLFGIGSIEFFLWMVYINQYIFEFIQNQFSRWGKKL